MTKTETELLQRIITVLYDWSGVSNDTPDDTEIVGSSTDSITLGDLRDASALVERLKTEGK